MSRRGHSFAQRSRAKFRLLLATLLTVGLTPLSAAGADPAVPADVPTLAAAARPAPNGSHLVGAASAADGMIDLQVYSAAMDSVLTVKVRPAPDNSRPAPALYLLNGASGGSDASNWFEQTDIAGFFRDKQVNVVVPMGGNGSYFADWRADDPVLGKQRWTTFLTSELPPVIDSALNGTGANAVAGISMAGTSVFQLALAAPGVYRAIGSYSGCVQTSDLQGQAFVDLVVLRWRGNPVNLWGPPNDPAWTDNDAFLHAEQLRGTAIYVSTGTGVPGPLDNLAGPGIQGNPGKLIGQLVSGGVLEAIINGCARSLQARLGQLEIPATFSFRPTGTHSWGYWQEDLHDSWPLMEEALNR
ncbi:alpha/beta hydrolase family protein [Nocardia sp. BMG51109]|uniref:alpha/beta hydrolase n=1 Tax=Nocardia sp. BMG51109 TaxID=1056816 RepID=UPI0004B64EB3|nr:alpha/beta hydrolase family protein [Nocardia sp. BMG51109]